MHTMVNLVKNKEVWTRKVNVLSTVHNSSTFTNKIRSRFADNHYKEIEKPRAIALYSKYMSGVDLTDQQVSYTALTMVNYKTDCVAGLHK